MYFIGEEHNPPYIHAIYNDNTASIIKNVIIEGDLSVKAKTMVLEWVNLRKDELLDIWNTQEFKTIDPLE